MIYSLMVVVFVLGYLAIALEHNIKIDKAASALMTGTICWALYVIGAEGIIDFHSVPHWISDMFAEEKNITDQHEIVTHYVTEFQILEHLGKSLRFYSS